MLNGRPMMSTFFKIVKIMTILRMMKAIVIDGHDNDDDDDGYNDDDDDDDYVDNYYDDDNNDDYEDADDDDLASVLSSVTNSHLIYLQIKTVAPVTKIISDLMMMMITMITLMMMIHRRSAEGQPRPCDENAANGNVDEDEADWIPCELQPKPGIFSDQQAAR